MIESLSTGPPPRARGLMQEHPQARVGAVALAIDSRYTPRPRKCATKQIRITSTPDLLGGRWNPIAPPTLSMGR